jgi:GNAT superfamily N-acetyltransferase
MISLLRTDSSHPDFIGLVKQLDQFLADLDGEDHAFYSTFNTIQSLKHVVLAYEDGQAKGCGAFKHFSQEAAEIKRMYVLPDHRGKGIAPLILNELETWAKELNHTSCVLETGKNNPTAVHLYLRSGYETIPNYGQYIGVANSVCMKKVL